MKINYIYLARLAKILPDALGDVPPKLAFADK
jgi:hypothetical protein